MQRTNRISTNEKTQAAHGPTGQRPHSGRSSVPGSQEPSNCLCSTSSWKWNDSRPRSSYCSRFNQHGWLSVFEQGCWQSVERLRSTTAPGGTTVGRDRVPPEPAPPSISIPIHFLPPHFPTAVFHLQPTGKEERAEHTLKLVFFWRLFHAL